MDERPNNIPTGFGWDLLEEALVVEAEVEGYLVRRVHIDEGAFVEILFEQCFNMLHPSIRVRLVETQTKVSGFSAEQFKPLGKIELDVCFGGSGLCRRAIMKFTIIPVPSPYNIILGRPGLKQLRAIPYTIHGKEWKETGSRATGRNRTGGEKGSHEAVLVNPAYPEQLVAIGKGLSLEASTQLKNLLKKNKDIFTWEPSDIIGVPKRTIKHSLNTVSQKRRVFCSEKSQVITKEVTEWLKAGIVRPVKYPTWISNPVLVKKVDGSWRMCIDFKNINAACPKDYYPLPEMDNNIKSIMGFPLKYDMVVKSKSEREMLADIAETFDNLRRINMKLNPKSAHLG
ncbi:hypothetical protein Tco_0001122 [Tanacetum coccineum]